MAPSAACSIWTSGSTVAGSRRLAECEHCLVAVIVEVGDMKFTMIIVDVVDRGVEEAVTGCPAVGEVEVAVVAYMQDCAPVIDWVAEPWRAGEVAPMQSGSLQVHEETVLHRWAPILYEISGPSVVCLMDWRGEVSVGAIWLQELALEHSFRPSTLIPVPEPRLLGSDCFQGYSRKRMKQLRRL